MVELLAQPPQPLMFLIGLGAAGAFIAAGVLYDRLVDRRRTEAYTRFCLERGFRFEHGRYRPPRVLPIGATMLRSFRWSLVAALVGVALVPWPGRGGWPRAASAAQGQWVLLGTRQVDFRVDHDIVRATGEGRFRRVRLVVEGGDLEMFDVRITFGDGATFSPATRFYFKDNSRDRVIDLPGGARIIRWINFYYRSVPGGGQGKATIQVYGRR